MKKFPSELRFDLMSEDWVVIATGRSRRPETFRKERRAKEEVPRELCPFEKIETQERPTLIFNQGQKVPFGPNDPIPKNWTTIVIPNKYPALIPAARLEKIQEGEFYLKMKAVGFHEVVITRDHERQMAQFSVVEIKEVLDVYQARYLDLMEKKLVNYIAIFHNHGREAGASISHPHSQIITTPLLDSDLKKALANSRRYFKKERKCIYCLMNRWEKRFKKRIVFENEDFLVICPFASKVAFETIISPQKHLSRFEEITEKQKLGLAEAFRIALAKIYRGLNDPAYNFYLHSAPPDGRDHSYYHWHWTILPKTATPAGFELGVKIEISTIEPERAAEYLRKQ